MGWCSRARARTRAARRSSRQGRGSRTSLQRALTDGLCVRLAVPRLECMARLECTAGNSSSRGDVVAAGTWRWPVRAPCLCSFYQGAAGACGTCVCKVFLTVLPVHSAPQKVGDWARERRGRGEREAGEEPDRIFGISTLTRPPCRRRMQGRILGCCGLRCTGTCVAMPVFICYRLRVNKLESVFHLLSVESKQIGKWNWSRRPA